MRQRFVGIQMSEFKPGFPQNGHKFGLSQKKMMNESVDTPMILVTVPLSNFA